MLYLIGSVLILLAAIYFIVSFIKKQKKNYRKASSFKFTVLKILIPIILIISIFPVLDIIVTTTFIRYNDPESANFWLAGKLSYDYTYENEDYFLGYGTFYTIFLDKEDNYYINKRLIYNRNKNIDIDEKNYFFNIYDIEDYSKKYITLSIFNYGVVDEIEDEQIPEIDVICIDGNQFILVDQYGMFFLVAEVTSETEVSINGEIYALDFS